MNKLILHALPLAAFLSAGPLLHAATKTWDGGGALEKWASGINWEGNNAPVAGDELIWPRNGGYGYITDNNFPAGTVFSRIEITSEQVLAGLHVADGWTHRGNRVAISEMLQILSSEDQGQMTRIEFPISLAAPAPGEEHVIDCKAPAIFTETISMGAFNLSIYGGTFEAPISGSGRLLLGADGTLMASNNLTGEVVLSGFHGADWVVENAGGLGNTAERTILDRGAELAWQPGTCGESFFLGTGTAASELHFDNAGGTTYTGIIELEGKEGASFVAVKHPRCMLRAIRCSLSRLSARRQ
jgi:hypothetical protein